MSRRDKEKKGGRGGNLPPFKPIYNYVWKSPAWAALRPTERCAYLEVKFRYQGDNNGNIAISAREIAVALGVSKDTAARAFRRLIEAGFIVVEKSSGFNRKNRRSAEYRLTEEPNDLPGASRIPTKDFMRIGGKKQTTVRPQGHHGTTTGTVDARNRSKSCPRYDERDLTPPKQPFDSTTTGTLSRYTIGGASGTRSPLVKSMVEMPPTKGIESDANQKAIAINAEPFPQASDCGTPIEAIIQKPIFSLIKKMELVECDS